MTSIWVESLGRTFDQALDLLAAAVRDCTDDLWESSMWEVAVDVFGPQPPGPDGSRPSPTQQRVMCSPNDAQRPGAWRGTRSKSSTTISPVSSFRARHRPRLRTTRTGC